MYEIFYNLKKRPFQLDHDIASFFENSSQKRAISYLHYGLTQREGFIVITGDSGVGKTMLSYRFLNSLNKENVIASQIVFGDSDDTEGALRLITKAFSLPYENLSKATLLKNLETFFLEQVKNGKQVLLVVDEAQDLSIRLLEELRMLSNFTLDGRALLQTFLLGNTTFKDTLQNENLEQLRQRVIAAYQLEPMSLGETRAYIAFQLKSAGWQRGELFDNGAIAKIYEYSEGIPKKINILCDCILQVGYRNKLKSFDSKLVELAIEEVASGHFPVEKVSMRPIVTLDSFSKEASGSETGMVSRAESGLNEGKIVKEDGLKDDKDDFEGRIATLEQRITELEEQLRKERKRIKKLILLMEDD